MKHWNIIDHLIVTNIDILNSFYTKHRNQTRKQTNTLIHKVYILIKTSRKNNNSTSRCRAVSWRKSWNIHTSNGNRNNKVVNRHRDPHLQRLFPTTQMMKMKSRWSKFDRIPVSVNNLRHPEAPTILYYTVSGVKCCMTHNHFSMNYILIKINLSKFISIYQRIILSSIW